MTYLLIDTNSLMFRAYSVSKKQNMNPYSIRVFQNMFNKALKLFKPDEIHCAFDTKGSKDYRLSLDENYKGTRKEIDENYILYGNLVKKWLKTLSNVYLYEKQGYEADDIVYTLNKDLRSKYYYNCNEFPYFFVDILTGDKDYIVMSEELTSVHLMRSGLSDIVTYSYDVCKEKLGVYPYQMTEYKMLSGDPSDNIKGPLSAAKASEFLSRYNTIDNIFENIEMLPTRYKNKLLESKEQLELNRKLIELRYIENLKPTFSAKISTDY